MAGLFNDLEEARLASWQVNKAGTGTNLVLRLYKNNWTPQDGDTTAQYVEATFTGYAPIPLNGPAWVITPDAPTLATFAMQQFTSSLDQPLQNVYGYYLTRGADLVFAERFTTGPYSIVNNLDNIQVTPNLDYKKQGE